jgi:CRP/FNR family transcriptional regulator
MSNQPLVAFLARLPLLADLAERDLQALGALTHHDHFADNAIIFRQGDACDRVWVLRAGQVKIIHHEADGREVILEMISPGEVFGGATLFFPHHPATAQTFTPVETISFAHDHYVRLLHTHPDMAIKLVRMMGARLHSMMSLQILAGERVERRMAHILLKLAERAGRPDPDGVLITIPLARQDLADMAGTTLETAIRTISRFRQNSWVVTRRGGYLVITNEPALRQQAQP